MAVPLMPKRTPKFACGLLSLALAAGIVADAARAETLYGAMVKAYANNPDLRNARAALRITDEGVPQALSGWRPDVSVVGEAGKERSDTSAIPEQNLTPLSATLRVTQSLYSGGQTVASTARAEADVRAQRASLLGTEQDALLNAVTVYVDVIRDQANIGLTTNNEKVLAEQRRATGDRFEVGEVTRTDVAQSEARLARATAERITAEGALAVSAASYERVIGEAPAELDAVPPLPPLHSSLKAAVARALEANPTIIEARLAEESARHDVRAAYGRVLPSLDLIGGLATTDEASLEDVSGNSASLTLRATIPLYQTGLVHSQVRQAKETRNQARIRVEQARRLVIEAATQAWEALITTRSNLVAREKEIEANEIALEGVKQEAIFGSRTVLDVLDAEQELLDSRVTYITVQRNEYVAAYQLLSAVGGLTAAKLQLAAKLYDPTAHYDKVRNKWFGLEVPE